MKNSLPRNNITDRYTFPENFLKNPVYFSIKVIPDDLTLDVLSFQLYNDARYWDLLFYINNMSSINSLPKSFEKVESIIDMALEEQIKKYPIIKNNQVAIDAYTNILRNKYNEDNEIHRRFKVIRKEYLTDFVRNINHESA